MSVQVRRRREAASFLASFVGAQGELIVDTTNNRIQVHDGMTPGGSPAAKLSEVVTNTRVSVNDANYTVLPTDRTIAYVAITAARIVTLPAAGTYPTGTQLLVIDESGACSATNTITLARAGSDTINNTTSAVVVLPFGFVTMVSNGSSRWTIADQATASMAQQSAGAVAISGGTIDATPIGATTRSTGAFTALTVSSTMSLPANSLANAYLAQMPTLTLKANITGAGATPADNTLSAILDASQGATRGSVLYRGAGGWTALVPGSTGAVLTSNGTGADPTFQPLGGAAALSVPVRQTVMAGPIASGAPGFLPATSASLTLTAQNVSSAAPLIVTAAQGAGASGALNALYQFTVNPSWTLTANAINYLYVNAQTGATGTTTLQPIYQFGGAISTASGQFSFDYQAMIGYLGNGTAAIVTPLVFVGEAVTGTSTITSSIDYAYNGFWDSGWTNTLPAVATGSGTLPHDIGIDQLTGQLAVECLTADTGAAFAVGDTSTGLLGGNLAASSTYYSPVLVVSNRLTASFVAAQAYAFPKKTTGVVTAITAVANFKWRVVVRRSW